MRPALALLFTALIPGCSNWTGMGFDARGPEMPRIREALKLQPGMAIADVGAGKGQLSAALAGEVGGDGRIFATDVDADRVQALREKFSREKLANVSVVHGTASNTRLPRACCDAIVVRRAYHHLTQPMEMNASLREALRPGGVLAVIDMAPVWPWPPEGVPKNRGGHGVASTLVVEELTRSGFALVAVLGDWPSPPLHKSYCALFRRLD